MPGTWRRVVKLGDWRRPRKALRSSAEKARKWKETHRKPLAAVGRRGKRLKKAGVLRGPLCDFVRGSKCDVPSCNLPGEAAHFHPTGRGYLDWYLLDRIVVSNVFSLCPHHHRTGKCSWHAMTPFDFANTYNFRPSGVAVGWGNKFKHHHPEKFAKLERSMRETAA